MVALKEDVPRRLRRDLRLAEWKLGNFAPVVGRVERADAVRGLPSGAKGYREASAEIEREIHRLWEWLQDIHAAGRPRNALPPRAPEALRAPSHCRRGLPLLGAVRDG